MTETIGCYEVAPGVEVLAYRSGEDDALVVEIRDRTNCQDPRHDPRKGPRMRVYLNDAILYENPKYPELPY